MRSPMFTVVTLVTIALGVGANSAIFSVINGILLKPLPYHEPERLVSVWQTAPGIGIKDLIFPFQFERAKVSLGNFSYQSIARLKPGVTLAQANADIARMIPMVNTKFPPPPGFSAKLFEDARIQPSVRLLMQDVVGDL